MKLCMTHDFRLGSCPRSEILISFEGVFLTKDMYVIE
jgi:hypothetical protein